MKTLCLLIIALASVQFCLAQMNPQYDSYTTYALDANNNIYQTVVVEGSTTGSCFYTCGPNNQQCEFSWCSSATHTPKIHNVVGGVGGWYTGGSVSPFSYLSYQVTENLQAQTGQNVSSTTEGDVFCSVMGELFSTGWTGTVRITVATYALATVNGDGTASYNLSCPNGNQNATCGTAHYLGSQAHLWAEEFSIYSNPGGCFFVNFIQFKDGPPAPYPCK